jgi:hypothetical protein
MAVKQSLCEGNVTLTILVSFESYNWVCLFKLTSPDYNGDESIVKQVTDASFAKK